MRKTRITTLSVTLALALAIALPLSSCAAPPASAPAPASQESGQAQAAHSKARTDLEDMLSRDPSLRTLLEKSIAAAHKVNPSHDTNPVDSVDALLDYVDWLCTCMPWNVLRDASYPTLYDSIDQSVDYIWFIFDQPLEELEGKGYYYPTLQYHEPISSWLKEYSQQWGSFLSTPESWNDEYYQRIKNDPTMNMQRGWYADTNVWTSFNDWFSRRLVDPSVRPIADVAVVAPADSKPQGVWSIDEKSQMKAPRMSAYFAKLKTPPSSLLTIPRTGSQFSTFVMSDAIRFATMGTMHHIKMNASTLHNDVIERKRISHSPNC